MCELPSNKRVVVRIFLSCEKGASPVSMDTKGLHVLLALCGEDIKPVPGILELWNVLFRNVKLLHNLVLSVRWSCNFGVLFNLFSGGLIRLSYAICNFAFDAVCGGLNRHACAMEAEWEKHSFAELSLVSDLELSFTHGVAMT